jgi:transcriptional regulator with XRE-family HTH domain
MGRKGPNKQFLLSNRLIGKTIADELGLSKPIPKGTVNYWRKKFLFPEGEPDWIDYCKENFLTSEQELAKRLILDCDKRIMGPKGPGSKLIGEFIADELGLSKPIPKGTIHNWRKGQHGFPPILFPEGEPDWRKNEKCLSDEQKLVKELILDCDERIMGREGPNNRLLGEIVTRDLGLSELISENKVKGWRKGKRGKPGILFPDGEPNWKDRCVRKCQGYKQDPHTTRNRMITRDLCMNCYARKHRAEKRKAKDNPERGSIRRRSTITALRYNPEIFDDFDGPEESNWDHLKDEAYVLYQMGFLPTDIALELGIKKSTVAKWESRGLLGDPWPDVDYQFWYDRGLTDVEIAKKVQRHKGTVGRWRLRQDPPLPPHTIGSKYQFWYDRGLTDVEIAEKTGKTRKAVGKWRREKELPPNPIRYQFWYDRGLTDIEIAAQIGKHRSSVRAWRLRQDPPLPLNKKISIYRRWYDRGLTDVEIAEKTGKTPHAVCSWRLREGGLSAHSVYRRWYDQGFTDAEIAKKTDKSVSTVNAWRLGQGLPSNYKPQLPDYQRWYDRGFTDAEIAKKVNRTRQSVVQWRRRQIPPLPKHEH